MSTKSAIGARRAWSDATVEGFRAMAAGYTRVAAEMWAGALHLVDPSDATDLRVAASQSNAGVGAILLGRMREAETLLDAAERAWGEVAARIQILDVPVAGVSSSFHFRLASENFAAFQGVRRARLAQMCDASLAITRFNRLFATASPPAADVVADQAHKLAALLSETLGPRAPEVRLLTASSPCDPHGDPALSPYAEKAAFVDRPPTLTDALSDSCRTLEAALALTALLGPYDGGEPFDEDWRVGGGNRGGSAK